MIYKASEIFDLLHLLDLHELGFLGEIISGDLEHYTINELDFIHANFLRRVRKVAKKECLEVMDRIWKI